MLSTLKEESSGQQYTMDKEGPERGSNLPKVTQQCPRCIQTPCFPAPDFTAPQASLGFSKSQSADTHPTLPHSQPPYLSDFSGLFQSQLLGGALRPRRTRLGRARSGRVHCPPPPGWRLPPPRPRDAASIAKSNLPTLLCTILYEPRDPDSAARLQDCGTKRGGGGGAGKWGGAGAGATP